MTDVKKKLVNIRRAIVDNRYQIMVIIIALAVVSVFVIWYVLHQHTVFFWDNSAYWMKTRGLTTWLETSTKAAIVGVIESIRYDEYNLFFAVPLTVFDAVFGGSRLVYILSIFGLYFVPATLLLALVCYRLTAKLWISRRFNSSWKYTITWLYVALNPFIILPVLGGYPDIVGLIPLSLALLIYLKYRSFIKVKHLVFMALLLLTATLLRRWYVFGAAGLILTVCVDQVTLLQVWNITKQKVIKLLKLTVLPLVYAGTFILIAFDYVRKLLSTDYSIEYAAYKFHHNYFELGLFVLNHYGLFLTLLAVAGIIGVLINKRANRKLIIAVLLSQVFAFFAVGRVQTFDTHQYYLLTIGLLIGIGALPFVFTRYKAKIVQPIIFGVIALVFLGSWASMYGYFNPMFGFSNVKAQPESRNDIATLKKIYTDVRTLDTRVNSPDTVYVLACSFQFNIDLFRNIPLSTDATMTPIQDAKFTPTAIFDVAQGFDKSFFTSDIVIDSTPVGYITTNKNEQQVIEILHKELMTGGKLNPYYQLTNSYSIEDGYTVTVLKRMDDIPQAVRDDIISQIIHTHKEQVPVVE